MTKNDQRNVLSMIRDDGPPDPAYATKILDGAELRSVLKYVRYYEFIGEFAAAEIELAYARAEANGYHLETLREIGYRRTLEVTVASEQQNILAEYETAIGDKPIAD